MLTVSDWRLWLKWFHFYGGYGMADHQGRIVLAFLQHELEEQVERWQRAGADQNVICEAFCAVYQQLTPDDKERQKLAQQQRMRAEQQQKEQGQ
jgi:hypothetical protein